MTILVVNIGSTSFKFRLLDMADESVLVIGGIEGVGKETGCATLQWGAESPVVTHTAVPDQTAAVAWCISALRAHGMRFDAVGFKAIHGGDLPEVVRVTPEVIRTMEDYADAAPAHNPVYVAAMRAFGQQMPAVPLVAAFETGFHQTIPATRTTYAIPYDWTLAHGIRRYGFHGASHRYIAQRAAELLAAGGQRISAGGPRIISCHLGGSSSLCAITAGRSVATTMGMTPQTGLPQNNRVGDFDPYALLRLKARTGLGYEALLNRLACAGGLLGITGFTNEMPEILATAATSAGAVPADRKERAELALGVFVESVRHYLGAYIVVLGGLDALVFTGGIGERSPEIRRRVCDGLGFLGIELDSGRNATAIPDAAVSADNARVSVFAVRTNEELIVARQTAAALCGHRC